MLGGLRYVCPDTNAGLVLRGLRLKGSGELRLSGGRWGHYPPGWRIVKRKKQEPILSGDHSVLHRHRIWLPAAKFRSLDLASLETMHAYLVTERRFELGKQGQLTMPEDVQWVCETRRQIVKDAVAALLDCGRAPVFDESPAFANLETFAEKKNTIHRKRAAIRVWIAQHQDGMGDSERLPSQEQNPGDTPRKVRDIADWQTSPTLPPAAEFARARMSDWDFDRVVYYVTHSECLRHSFQPREGAQSYGILTDQSSKIVSAPGWRTKFRKLGRSRSLRQRASR